MAAMIPHENYSPGGQRKNDILIVKTDQPFQLTQYVKIIKLAATENDAKGNFILCLNVFIGSSQFYNRKMHCKSGLVCLASRARLTS